VYRVFNAVDAEYFGKICTAAHNARFEKRVINDKKETITMLKSVYE
jgi:hypothetical protein